MATASVTVHSSQFPETVRRELLRSLRTGRINNQFHYHSYKQSQKWLALHEGHSPARTDADCLSIYDQSFAAAATRLARRPVHVIGLGCGGGQKDARLLQILSKNRCKISYSPCDVSLALALTASRVAHESVGDIPCHPLLCDLATATDLPDVFALRDDPSAVRVITFFGMMPNFKPDLILPRLASLVGPQDTLLLSANLAPGKDYAAGVKKVLPQYDNPLTRDWLITFLLDLGVESGDGKLRFEIERDPRNRLLRIAARFHFTRTRTIRIDSKQITFPAGRIVELFFSCRHTPDLLRKMLHRHGLEVQQQWITTSGEEGVFLATNVGTSYRNRTLLG